MKIYFLLTALLLAGNHIVKAQTGSVSGHVISGGKPVPFASITLSKTYFGTQADSSGAFKLSNIIAGKYK